MKKIGDVKIRLDNFGASYVVVDGKDIGPWVTDVTVKRDSHTSQLSATVTLLLVELTNEPKETWLAKPTNTEHVDSTGHEFGCASRYGSGEPCDCRIGARDLTPEQWSSMPESMPTCMLANPCAEAQGSQVHPGKCNNPGHWATAKQ